MNTVESIKTDLMKTLSEMSVIDQLVNTLYVDSNPCDINTYKISKRDNKIVKKKISKQYKLDTHKIIIKKGTNKSLIISDQLELQTISTNNEKLVIHSASENLNHNFISFLKSNSSQIDEFNLYNQNLIKKIFNRNTIKKLISLIINYSQNYNWIIISPQLYKELTKNIKFEEHTTDVNCLITHAGSFNNLHIYVNKGFNENVIYFGKYNSITLILNSLFNLKEIKCLNESYHSSFSITLEYKFIKNDDVKILKLV